MNKQDSLICGCLLCDGRCERKANMRRSEAIGIIANTEPNKKLRHKYQKALKANIQVVDCIIIHKRLKQILNGNRN